jgi:NADH dehydrogenase/NADH:ubiquinone oxidoreductase subunit G
MSDLIQFGFDYAALPAEIATKAQIAASNIKLRLKRTVEDIIEIGRELTAVKAELPHGQFLPWIEREFEMSHVTATQFMNVAERFGGQILNNLTFKPTVLYALAAPSTPESVVNKAIEKVEAGDTVTVADVKDWKAELEAERQARLKAEQQSQEWKDQWKTERDTKRELETQVDLLKVQAKPEVIEKVVEVIPKDYESAKQKAGELQAQLADLQKQQTKLVNEQVKSKLKSYQSELDAIEKQKALMQSEVDRMKAYMASLNNEAKRIETHQSVIEKQRLELISLAAFLNDLDPMNDQDTVKRWQALAQMHEEAATTIRLVFGDKRPSLT